MIAGLPFAFGAPAILFGLLALPVIWWLLRLTPPRPAGGTLRAAGDPGPRAQTRGNPLSQPLVADLAHDC